MHYSFVKLYYCLINKIYKKDDVFSILSEIVPSKTTQRKISLTELHRKLAVTENGKIIGLITSTDLVNQLAK
jgi:hypothetical protein